MLPDAWDKIMDGVFLAGIQKQRRFFMHKPMFALKGNTSFLFTVMAFEIHVSGFRNAASLERLSNQYV